MRSIHNGELQRPIWKTGAGDWWLATTLSGDDHGRRSILRALSTFMAWKQAMAFTLASELLEPDCVYCCGVSGSERWAVLVTPASAFECDLRGV